MALNSQAICYLEQRNREAAYIWGSGAPREVLGISSCRHSPPANPTTPAQRHRGREKKNNPDGMGRFIQSSGQRADVWEGLGDGRQEPVVLTRSAMSQKGTSQVLDGILRGKDNSESPTARVRGGSTAYRSGLGTGRRLCSTHWAPALHQVAVRAGFTRG